MGLARVDSHEDAQVPSGLTQLEFGAQTSIALRTDSTCVLAGFTKWSWRVALSGRRAGSGRQRSTRRAPQCYESHHCPCGNEPAHELGLEHEVAQLSLGRASCLPTHKHSRLLLFLGQSQTPLELADPCLCPRAVAPTGTPVAAAEIAHHRVRETVKMGAVVTVGAVAFAGLGTAISVTGEPSPAQPSVSLIVSARFARPFGSCGQRGGSPKRHFAQWPSLRAHRRWWRLRAVLALALASSFANSAALEVAAGDRARPREPL